MPKSDPPRKPYHDRTAHLLANPVIGPEDGEAWKEQLHRQRMSEVNRGPISFSEEERRALAEMHQARSNPEAKARWLANKPPLAHSVPRRRVGGKLVAAAGLTALGAGLAYRHNKRKQAAVKSFDLIDPFTETVSEFSKGRSGDGTYRVVWPPAGATSLRSLVPTGRNVGTANNLVHVHGKKTKGRNANSLEVYHKAYEPSMGRALHEAAEQARQGSVIGHQTRAKTTKSVLDLRSAKSGSRFQNAGARGMKIT
jgi:hypothetical protein